MDGLKRLSGAREVDPDADVINGKGSWIVHFTGAPKVGLKAISEAVPKYKVEGIKAKLLARIAEKDGKYSAGEFALTNGAEKDAPDILKEIAAFLKDGKETLVVRGVLSEDEKGRQSLALYRVDEPKK